MAATLGAAAHDIPTDVKINAFIKPEGHTLELLLRVPLAAMIEVDLPTRGPGYLDLSRADDALRHATKIYLIDNITLYEDGAPLPPPRITYARVSLASDRSFTSTAGARTRGRPAARGQHRPLLEPAVARRAAGISDPLRPFRVLDPAARRPARADRLHRVALPAARRPERAFEFHGDPGLVRLDPRWHQAAWRFVESGFWHILEGTDHLLFLLCLVIPFRRLRPLVIIVTAVHCRAFDLADRLGLRIRAGRAVVPAADRDADRESPSSTWRLKTSSTRRGDARDDLSRRWIIAFAFGIVHGFGFSFALRESLQFAGDHLITALFGFNIGVEIGQLAVLLVLVPALDLLFRTCVPERLGMIILSALVAHTAWHWMIERGGSSPSFHSRRSTPHSSRAPCAG